MNTLSPAQATKKFASLNAKVEQAQGRYLAAKGASTTRLETPRIAKARRALEDARTARDTFARTYGL